MRDKLSKLSNWHRIPDAMQSEIIRLMEAGGRLINVCENLLSEDEKPEPVFLGGLSDYIALHDLMDEAIRRRG